MSRIYGQHWRDYELLDAGGSKKLERWGKIITIRPERNAYFKSIIPFSDWNKRADIEFVASSKTKGQWVQLNSDAPKEWTISYKKIQAQLKLTKFKHLGIFPEQQANWALIEEHIHENDRFLNLFGYTGMASLVARSKGADVFHCDSVRQIISWGRENMELSNLSDIHWVLEDALKFAQREVKRGHQYKGVIMDPPAFGIGAKNERWKIEDKFGQLLELALQLREEGGFVIANTYSPRLEEKDIVRVFHDLDRTEKIKVDTLCLRTTTDKVIEYGQRTLITD